MATADFSVSINVSAAPVGSAEVRITVSVSGVSRANAETVVRAGKCIAEIGRAIVRIKTKYDAETRRRLIP